MDDYFAIFLDKKEAKSQGCIPLCYPFFKILNKIELVSLRQNFVFHGFCSKGLRSRNTRPLLEGLLFSDGEAERCRLEDQIGSEIFVMKDKSLQEFASCAEVSVRGTVGQIASKVDKQLGYLPAMQVTRPSAGEDGKVCDLEY